MKKKYAQLHEKKLPELKEELKKHTKELFDLKMDQIRGKLKNLRSIYHKRKEIAVIKTIIREREVEK